MNSANEVQESIKIALDAADAATDVTSEYNKIKSENKKLEASVKQIHKFTTIIFGVSILAAVIGLSLTALIYSRTMNELTAMTNTSREALVVFAENVDGVKVALEKLETGIDEQARILETNNALIESINNLDKNVTKLRYFGKHPKSFIFETFSSKKSTQNPLETVRLRHIFWFALVRFGALENVFWQFWTTVCQTCEFWVNTRNC